MMRCEARVCYAWHECAKQKLRENTKRQTGKQGEGDVMVLGR
jgi:hypothetical protein